MSDPWPPAFMRTAAADRARHADRPLEAGEPGGDGLARQHGEADRSAGDDVRARRTVDLRGERPEHHGHTGEAAVGHEQVRAPADHEHGQPGLGRSRAADGQVVHRLGSDHERGRPADAVGRERAEGGVRARQRSRGSRRPLVPTAAAGVLIAHLPASPARTSSGSRSTSPQPIEMQTSPGRSSPSEERDELGPLRQPDHTLLGVGVAHRVDDELAR